MILEIANKLDVEIENKDHKEEVESNIRKIESMITTELEDIEEVNDGELYLAKDVNGNFIVFYINGESDSKSLISIELMRIYIGEDGVQNVFMEVLGKYDNDIKYLAY